MSGPRPSSLARVNLPEERTAVVARGEEGAVGREGENLAKVIVHSLILTTLMGIVAMLQAYVVPWMVPAIGR